MTAQAQLTPTSFSDLSPALMVNPKLHAALVDMFKSSADLSGLSVEEALALRGEHLVIVDLEVQGGLPLLEAIAKFAPQTKVLVISDALPANACLLYTSPSPRDGLLSRMPSSA